ncbi:MAG: hypothetical protein N2489_02390 [Clostridia bacterium]|nr:hypothetical protein [Clostridia bacterium]
MGNFSLIVYKKESARPSLLSKVLESFKKERFEDYTQEISLSENCKGFLVTLPYGYEKLHELRKGEILRFKNYMDSLVRDKSLENVILTEKLEHLDWLKDFKGQKYNGQTLYQALLVYILIEIFSGRGIKIGGLDIAVVHGQNNRVLFEIVGMLASDIKYLTVISDRKQELEEEMERIYSDTGLSVGITEDCRSGLKNADVIINLGNLGGMGINSRINPKALIINFCQVDSDKAFAENTIINSVEIKFPKSGAGETKEIAGEFFGSLQLAEIILMHKISGEAQNSVLKKLAHEFRKDGYAISGFVGRRTLIKTKGIMVGK